MKKKALQRPSVLALTLLATTLLASACGNNNGSSNSNASASTASQTASSASTAGSGSGESAKEPVTLNLFVDQTWWPLKDWSGDVPEEITKRTGVKLNITVATDDKQLPLMIASGDLPDLVATSTQNVRMADSKLSLDWNSLIEQYAPDFKIDSENMAVNTAPDGKIYTIKNNFSTKEEWAANKETALLMGAGISVREDIMQALGNPQIKTMDDLTNLFQTVKDKYPDMIPLVLDPPNWHRGYFEQNFGVMPGLNDVDGKMQYGLHLPGNKAMYLYMNELYRKGFIKAENYAYKSEDQGKQLMYSGKGFAFAWTTQGSDLLTSAATDTGYKFVNLPLKLSDDFKYTSTSAGWQGVYITKNNKNPEASIKLMAFLRSEEGQRLAMWGVEGKDWSMSADNKYPVFTYDHLDDNLRKKKGVYYWGLLTGSATTELSGNFVPGTDSTKAGQELTALANFNSAIGLVVPDADSQEQVIKNNIENLVKNEEAKVLLATSAEAAAKAYDNMVAQADKMGLGKYEAWANTKYEEVKKNFQQ
ncbi:hypothetical protein ACFSR7_02245 [Cohnella sp. GCM10020058]|uniref:hypothetical protein n=1 Tax=Cohnella sp. GCM10020058 TaxID=3317330 RepID=UPI0036445F1D